MHLSALTVALRNTVNDTLLNISFGENKQTERYYFMHFYVFYTLYRKQTKL